jgi:hypothetical protein
MVSEILSYQSVRRWRLHSRLHQRFGQPANFLAQRTAILLREQLSNDRGEILLGRAARDFDISRPIPKHDRRSPKSGACSGRGVPLRKDLNGDSTNHSLIHRDRKGDAQCHTLQSERRI